MITYRPDPKLDLVFERIVDVAPELVWRAWTTPDYAKRWLTPAPWKTVDCEIDLRPGGLFRFVMESPEGQRFPHHNCYLEIVPNQRLTWTAALGPSFRPSTYVSEVPIFTAVIMLEPHAKGTKYTALVMHSDEVGRQKHADMGFHDGWGKATDQLVAVAKTM